MEQKLNSDKIQKLAKELDDAIEKQAIEELLSYFSDDCEVQLPGIRLTGISGLRKAITWMYGYLKGIVLMSITIMICEDTFFEEFIVKAVVKGREIEIKQTEVLVYNSEYKVKSLRLYFDRLELALAYVSNPLEKMMIRKISNASLKGLK